MALRCDTENDFSPQTMSYCHISDASADEYREPCLCFLHQPLLDLLVYAGYPVFRELYRSLIRKIDPLSWVYRIVEGNVQNLFRELLSILLLYPLETTPLVDKAE